MAGINKTILMGHVGNKTELKTKDDFKAINFSLAVQTGYGEKKETTWFAVTAFNKLADIVNQYVNKGSKLYIEGSIKVEKWIDNTNAKREKFKIIAREIVFLDSKPKEGTVNAIPIEQELTIKDDDVPF